MKLFNKKPKEDILTKLVDRELSAFVKEKDVEYHTKHLATAQKLSVLKFDVLPKKARIIDYISSLRLDYQKLIDYCDNRINGKLQEAKGGDDIADMQSEEKDLTRQINEIENVLAVVKGKFDNKAKKYKAVIGHWKRALVVLIFLAGFELVSNLQIYSLLGGGILASASIAIISGIVVFYWAHITVKMLRKYGGKNIKRQLLVFIIMATPILIIFSLFSTMRVDYLLALAPDMKGVYSNSPVVPTMINFFAYLIATYLVFEYRPNTEIKNAYKKYKDDVKEIQQLETQRNEIIREKNALAPKLRKRLMDYKNMLLLGQQTEQEINTRMLACFYAFKSELFLLSNGKCASLFTNDIGKDLEPLHMNYQDINNKNLQI